MKDGAVTYQEAVGKFKKGWLKRQLDRAKKDIDNWPPEKKALIPDEDLPFWDPT